MRSSNSRDVYTCIQVQSSCSYVYVYHLESIIYTHTCAAFDTLLIMDSLSLIHNVIQTISCNNDLHACALYNVHLQQKQEPCSSYAREGSSISLWVLHLWDWGQPGKLIQEQVVMSNSVQCTCTYTYSSIKRWALPTLLLMVGTKWCTTHVPMWSKVYAEWLCSCS